MLRKNSSMMLLQSALFCLCSPVRRRPLWSMYPAAFCQYASLPSLWCRRGAKCRTSVSVSVLTTNGINLTGFKVSERWCFRGVYYYHFDCNETLCMWIPRTNPSFVQQGWAEWNRPGRLRFANISCLDKLVSGAQDMATALPSVYLRWAHRLTQIIELVNDENEALLCSTSQMAALYLEVSALFINGDDESVHVSNELIPLCLPQAFTAFLQQLHQHLLNTHRRREMQTQHPFRGSCCGWKRLRRETRS